jgi:RNA polymerase-binding transcription factor DksA
MPFMEDIPENEQPWERSVEAQSYKCEACGRTIPAGEREIYFKAKLCEHCANNVDED